MDNEKKEYLEKIFQKRSFLHDHHKILATENFELAKKINDFIDLMYNPQNGAIDRKIKEFLFIAVLAVKGAPKEHMKLHIDVAVKHGATKEEFFEVLNLIFLLDGAATYKYVFDALQEVIPLGKLEPDS